MGQKVHPYSIRIGINRTWLSKWYADRDYANLLHEDIMIRREIKRRLKHAGISKVEIERFTKRIRINIYTARPGIIIGRRGGQAEELKRFLGKLTDKTIHINIREIKPAELDAQLIAESIANQLERRISHRRAMKRAIETAMKEGAQGVRVCCKGRLGGSEMKRREWYHEGRVPLHTLRADMDYGFVEAKTTYGMIGVKVWVYRGEKSAMTLEELGVPQPSQGN